MRTYHVAGGPSSLVCFSYGVPSSLFTCRAHTQGTTESFVFLTHISEVLAYIRWKLIGQMSRMFLRSQNHRKNAFSSIFVPGGGLGWGESALGSKLRPSKPLPKWPAPADIIRSIGRIFGHPSDYAIQCNHTSTGCRLLPTHMSCTNHRDTNRCHRASGHHCQNKCTAACS